MCGCICKPPCSGKIIKVSKNASIIEGILYIQHQDFNRDFVQIIEIAYIEGDEVKDYEEEVIIILNKKPKPIQINRNYNCYRIDGRIFKKIGKYDIKIIINPRITYFSFHDNTNLLSVDLSKVKTSNINNMHIMFFGCTILNEIKGLDFFNTSNVQDMSNMFEYCYNLEIIDNLSYFDTSNVVNMQLMFNNCNKLKKINGIENFNTSKVTNMFGMFCNCYKLEYLDLSKFDTSNTTHMKRMFYNCSKLKEIEGIDDILNVCQVVNMDGMLYGCNKLKNIDLSKLDRKIISA
jgi:surface protein